MSKKHLSHHGQVYLMAAPPSAFTGVVFQTHLGLLNGAVAALLFPVLDTYTMPGEVSKAIKAVKVKTLAQIFESGEVLCKALKVNARSGN